MRKAKIQVLLADDHTVVRSGIAAILSFESDIVVVGEAANGQEAVEMATELKPDVVVMDLAMPVMDGASATAKITASLSETHVIVLTSYGTSNDLVRALDAGAIGAVLKTVSGDGLVSAIRLAANGEEAIDPGITKMLKTEPAAITLTDRQREILTSVTRGLTNEDIAKQFGISANAVKHHLSAIFAKIGTANRAEAAAYAFKRHLTKS
ncbi:MAG: response regulator transcription factor [Kiritimatiellae bacterium]|nr:response regulator transcription factor [Kiritimatiellia bacterium]